MNRLHVVTRIQGLALEGKTDIFKLIRDEIPSDGDCGVTWGGMAKKDIEAFADNTLKMIKAISFNVERERMRLDTLEGGLRADVLDALDALDLSNPRDAREIFEAHQQIGASTGPASLRTAIDMIAAADGTSPDLVKDLTDRMLYLYPEADDDAE